MQSTTLISALSVIRLCVLLSIAALSGFALAQANAWSEAWKIYESRKAGATLPAPSSAQRCFLTDPMPPECAELFKRKPDAPQFEQFGRYLKFNTPTGTAAGLGGGSCASPSDVREAVKVALEDLGFDRSTEVDSTIPTAQSGKARRFGVAGRALKSEDFEKREKEIKTIEKNPITTKEEKKVLNLLRETNKGLKDACLNPTSEFDKSFCWTPQ